jgi:N-acetylmuramoyl-L-alanine amidase
MTLWFAAILVPALAPQSPVAAPASLSKVNEIRHWSQPDLTRVIVTLETEATVKPERLSNPDRIFFDIPNSKLDPSLKNKTLPVGDERVRQIRVAQTQIGVTRVVMDLAADSDFTVSTLTNPPRVVMELKSRAARVTTAPPAPPSATPPAPTTPPPTATPLPSRDRQGAVPAKVEAAKLPRREQNLIRALGLKISRVVIDPGHGGHDTGTIGPSGLMEKDLALDVAKRLADLVADRLGSEVVLTRTDDSFIALEERTALANEKQADLFISVHANSSRAPSARGIETYYLNLTSDREAMEVAARENASSNKSIHELQDLVTKITLTEKIAESREFAGHVQRSLQKTTALRNRGVRKAPFVVLIGARMPSVLAEISFLSNPRDERLLKTPAYRQKLAEALLQGMTGYVQSLSRVEVAARD